MSQDGQRVATFVERVLKLSAVRLCEEHYYQSLTLCVIDAVFSINTRYKAVQNVITRYCDHFGLRRVRQVWTSIPARDEQESVSDLCKKYDKLGVERFADDIYRNHQRTSPRSGILKADAVRLFADVLQGHTVECLQDVPKATQNARLEAAVRRIPGQGSGLSLRYLWMLAGSDALITPNRMIMRFLHRVLDREPTPEDAQSILFCAAQLLSEKHDHLTPRLLDYEIWQFETVQEREGA